MTLRREQTATGVDVLDRRRFLGHALAAAAVCAGSGYVRAEDATWKMRLSASSINFSSLPIEEAAAKIAALGFDAIDIWSAYAGCPHLDDVLTRLGPSGLKELLARLNLKLCSFSVYVGGYPRYAEALGRGGGRRGDPRQRGPVRSR